MKVNHKDDDSKPIKIVHDAQLNYLHVAITKLFNAVNSVKKINVPADETVYYMIPFDLYAVSLVLLQLILQLNDFQYLLHFLHVNLPCVRIKH